MIKKNVGIEIFSTTFRIENDKFHEFFYQIRSCCRYDEVREEYIRKKEGERDGSSCNERRMNERGNKSAWRVLLNGVYSPPISFFFNQTNEEKRFGISLLLPFLLCKTFGGIIKPSFQSKRCIEMYRFFFLFNLRI